MEWRIAVHISRLTFSSENNRRQQGSSNIFTLILDENQSQDLAGGG